MFLRAILCFLMLTPSYCIDLRLTFLHYSIQVIWDCCLRFYGFTMGIPWPSIGHYLYLPSGYLLHSHGIDGPFIDGLPFLNMVIFHGYVSHIQMIFVFKKCQTVMQTESTPWWYIFNQLITNHKNRVRVP
jgi:hypothetical protein